MGHTIIVSPHIDDAMLSMGGTICNWRLTNNDVKIKYIFSISDWCNEEVVLQSEYRKDVEWVTRQRKDEEQSIQREIQHDCEYFDFLDCPLRSNFDSPDTVEMVSEITKRLIDSINVSDICIFPLGLQHPDHILVREIGVELLKDNYSVFFYEDMPYMADSDYDFHDFVISLENLGLTSFCQTIDINKKKSLLSLYRSQVSQSWIRSIVNYSYNPSSNQFYERFWKPHDRLFNL